MRGTKLLLIVSRLDNPLLSKVDWDAMEKPFGASTHTVCDEEDCFHALVKSASAVIYLDGFAVSRKEVEYISSVQWNSPPVYKLSFDEECFKIEGAGDVVYAREYSDISDIIRASIKDKQTEIRRNRIAFVCFAIVAIALLATVHIAFRAQAQDLPAIGVSK